MSARLLVMRKMVVSMLPTEIKVYELARVNNGTERLQVLVATTIS